MLKVADDEPSKTAVPFTSSWKDLMMLRSLGGHSIMGRILKRPSLLTRLKAFVRSMKATEWLPLLSTFLLKLLEGEDHVYSGSVGTEAALRLLVDLLCTYLEPLQYYACKDFPSNTQEGSAMIIIAIASITFVSVQCDDVSMTLASLISCVTWPSLHQRQRISCNSVMSVSLQHFSTSAGIPSFPGTLPEARESRVLLSLSMVGSLSSSSSSDRHSMAFRALSVTTFSVAYSSVQCSTQRYICCSVS